LHKLWDTFIDIFPDIAFLFLALAGLGYLIPETLKRLEASRSFRRFLGILFLLIGVLAVVINHKSRLEQHKEEKTRDNKVDTIQKHLGDIVAELHRPKEQTVVEQLAHPPVEKHVEGHPGKIKAVGLRSTTPETELARRRNLLAVLRNEYILSHDHISAAMMAGTEQPPADWLNKRMKELGEKWTVSDDPKSEARGQLVNLLRDGKKLFKDGCDWLTPENGKETAPVLLTAQIFDWAQTVQSEIAIGAPERLPEFEKAVVWTSPEAVNRHAVRCADLSVKVTTLEAIVNNKPSSLSQVGQR
jgi:hypothetical protein